MSETDWSRHVDTLEKNIKREVDAEEAKRQQDPTYTPRISAEHIPDELSQRMWRDGIGSNAATYQGYVHNRTQDNYITRKNYDSDAWYRAHPNVQRPSTTSSTPAPGGGTSQPREGGDVIPPAPVRANPLDDYLTNLSKKAQAAGDTSAVSAAAVRDYVRQYGNIDKMPEATKRNFITNMKLLRKHDPKIQIPAEYEDHPEEHGSWSSRGQQPIGQPDPQHPVTVTPFGRFPNR